MFETNCLILAVPRHPPKFPHIFNILFWISARIVFENPFGFEKNGEMCTTPRPLIWPHFRFSGPPKGPYMRGDIYDVSYKRQTGQIWGEWYPFKTYILGSELHCSGSGGGAKCEGGNAPGKEKVNGGRKDEIKIKKINLFDTFSREKKTERQMF